MDQFNNKIIALRRDLHRHPELGFNEHRTKRKVAEFLKGLKNFDVDVGAGVTGVLKAGSNDRMIGFRADMDALPIQETNAHEYSSTNRGVMHACGHDGHTAMLLGAAALLSERPAFDGSVLFIFQPNEEHGLGARAMIEEGLLTRFPIQEIYGTHNLPGASVGQLSTRVGQICASESLFEIDIVGQGGHASMPHVGIDTITVGSELVMALQTIVSRKLAPSTGAVVSVTEFLTDGQRNVLPGHTTLKGDVRTRSPADRTTVEKVMRQIVQGIAATHAVAASMSFRTEFIETINGKIPTEAVVRVGQASGLEVDGDREPMSFSEDFAHFAAAVPGCFFLLGNGDVGSNGRPLHAADYDFNDQLLPIGSNLWAALARNRLPVVGDNQ